MWPGQQPPGGEQNPQQQNPNPYQQPGHQQQNPYQQPGYQQPNPYQQPTVPQYAVPGQPPGAVQPAKDEKKKTVITAIVAAAAVIATAVVTGVVVFKDDDKGTSDKAGGAGAAAPSSPSAAASTESDEPGESSESPADNPRGGADAKPTVPGWKVVSNPKHGTQFDVPADWEVAGTGVITGFEDEKKGDGSLAVGMSAPAHLKTKWCEFDSDKDGRKEDWGLATAGSKGGKGAKSAAEAAYNEAGNWSWAAYAQTEPKGTVKVAEAKDYTTASGLKGSVATATAKGVKKENKCETDGKSIAFSFKDAKGDFKTWILYANAGIEDEVPDETIQKILSTVRLAD
ncbi:hypothetical protein [Streptomyces sp. MUM 178J]|uniref:hypothetical protein n=1 Tax=Streptomyces sp. MUM 178J TaxID=2791991 RepID=UPI001F0393EF|nr:hypothetical protein [Streptomyces sp. MUM 178J]WRQ78344.1 hypothetical protein I3F59_002485 [Streptomyces sp. MUM 178J]